MTIKERIMMYHVSKETASILDILTSDLTEENRAKRIDNTKGVFMPVSVELLGDGLYSVTHYGEQNGDLMCDPDMIFLKQDGTYYPCTYRNDYLGILQEAVVLEDGKIKRHYAKLQFELTEFTQLWMRNIKHQQKLG
jgi:hypothetical protein